MDERETRRTGYALTIPDSLLHSDAMRRACAERNFREIFRLVNRRTGSSHADMAAAIGKMTSTRVSDIIRGVRGIRGQHVIERVADGFGIPGQMLGLPRRPWEDSLQVADETRIRDDMPLSDPGADVHDEATVATPPDTGQPRALLDTVEHNATPDVESGTRISIPIRTVDGRVIFVSVPRRDFILRGVGLGAGVSLGAVVPAAAEPMPNRRVRQLMRGNDSMSAAEHLRQVRRNLIDSDNLMGPRHVIPALQEQVHLIQHIRQNLRGGDGRDLLHLQAEYAELLGWCNQDLGDFRAAEHWMKQALEWSMMSGDSDMTAFFLARKSQLAGDMGNPLEAIDLGTAAERHAHPGSRVAIVAKTFAAFGHALRDERGDESQRELDEARELLSALDPDADTPWGVWLDESYIEVQRGRCLTESGRPQDAAEVYQAAIRGLPDGYHRDRGVYLARQGVAQAGARQPEQAAETGLQALAIGESTESGRIITELAHLDNALHLWRHLPMVADFREAMNDFIPQQA